MPETSKQVTYKSGLLVSNSPHMVTKLDTQRTMLYVLIGLLPSTIAATIYFGVGALLRIILGAVFACLAEFCYDKIMKKPNTTRDLSCLVTGVILAMNVPATLPVWMLCIGCCVSIIIVKCLYGGIGRNIANPALVGRIVLLLSWTSYMTTWPLTRFQTAVDATTGATPLGQLADGATQLPALSDMFLGNIGGALGETCTLAILIGVPIGLFTAIFLAEIAPPRVASIIHPAVDLLAGIPSVVYGLLGLVILNPLMYKWELALFRNDPTHQFTGGANMLSAILVLAIMILPTVISVSETSIHEVPDDLRSGSLALGATKMQTIFRVVLPTAKSGILTAVVLGVGRAIGEAMAITLVSGSSVNFPLPFHSVRFLTTAIVSEMGYASGLHRQALFTIGMVLFAFIMVINSILLHIGRSKREDRG